MKWYIILGVLQFFLLGCKKNQPQMTSLSEECKCVSEVSANFKMGEEYDGELFDLDTINIFKKYSGSFESLGSSYVKFEANIQNAISYEWQIGSNSTVQTTKEFGLYFNDTIGTIAVRLIVHAIPNKLCFPNDDGIDTTIRYLTLISMEKPDILGKFIGHNPNISESDFIIEIDTFSNSGSWGVINYGIKNLPFGNSFDLVGNLNSFSFYGTEESGSLGDAFIQLTPSICKGYFNKKTKQIEITYSVRYFSSDYTSYQTFYDQKFIGKKL